MYKRNIFLLNIYLCVCIYIHNEYKQYTHMYYVNTNFYFGCD